MRRRETRDERQETRDERRETRYHKMRLIVKLPFLFVLATVSLVAVAIFCSPHQRREPRQLLLSRLSHVSTVHITSYRPLTPFIRHNGKHTEKGKTETQRQCVTQIPVYGILASCAWFVAILMEHLFRACDEPHASEQNQHGQNRVDLIRRGCLYRSSAGDKEEQTAATIRNNNSNRAVSR